MSEQLFESKFLSIFVEEIGAVHYTWDMFRNLARDKGAQDRRVSSDYFDKKSEVGHSCYKMWLDCEKLSGESQSSKMQELAKRLKKWYEKESAMGLVENPNSQGRGHRSAKKKICADLDYLNKQCPRFAPWNEKSAMLLLDRDESDNAIVSGIKDSFFRLYVDGDERGLQIWDEERGWFYKNKRDIDSFVSKEKEPKEAMLRLLMFSNHYDFEYRQEFETKRYLFSRAK